MIEKQIEIIVKYQHIAYIQGVLCNFFNGSNPKRSIYVDKKLTTKRLGGDEVEAIYSNFRIVEASDDESIFQIPLARINMQPYPSVVVVFIENLGENNEDWEKVESITKEIIAKLISLHFEIESVTPDYLLPKSMAIPRDQEENIQHEAHLDNSSSTDDPLQNSTPESSEIKVWLPKRASTLKIWKITWKKIRFWVSTGMKYTELHEKIKADKSMSNLPCHQDTIAKIVRAGEAGLLENDS